MQSAVNNNLLLYIDKLSYNAKFFVLWHHRSINEEEGDAQSDHDSKSMEDPKHVKGDHIYIYIINIPEETLVQEKAFISNYDLILFDIELSLEVKDGDKMEVRPGEQDEDDSKALVSDITDLTSASTSRRQLDAGTLDAKVVKALKKQEEKREKRTLRKKEVYNPV